MPESPSIKIPVAAPTQPTLTSANMAPTLTPEPKVNPKDPWEGAEAKPLTSPAFDQIKVKNPNISVRWVNRSVTGSSTPHLRYEQMLAMGWVPATASDVDIPPGCLKDGHIQIFDVILMKIDRSRLLGALRYNNERVNKAVRTSGQISDANIKLQEEFAKEGVISKARGKVSVFVPGSKDLEQMTK